MVFTRWWASTCMCYSCACAGTKKEGKVKISWNLSGQPKTGGIFYSVITGTLSSPNNCAFPLPRMAKEILRVAKSIAYEAKTLYVVTYCVGRFLRVLLSIMASPSPFFCSIIARTFRGSP